MLAGATLWNGRHPANWLARLDPKVAATIRQQVPALLAISGAGGRAPAKP